MLYIFAIQTGLRASEIESILTTDLRLEGDKPHVYCRADITKNKKEARQYFDASLAAGLSEITAKKSPGASVFAIQAGCDLAEMLRADLADARNLLLAEAKLDAVELTRRNESDFLLPKNHQGETLDFHGLRHTCGAWLALQRVHLKTIQNVMRHSVITLTMDTYGHRLPDQQSDAVASMSGQFNRNN